MDLQEEINLEPRVTTLVLSLDFDGCLDTPDSRENLIDYLFQYCRANPQYTEIIVVIGSLRQSIHSDLYNAHLNSDLLEGELLSCSVLLTEFVDALSDRLNSGNRKIKVTAEKLLVSDILNNLEPGTMYDLISNSNYKEMYGIDKFRDIGIVDYNGCNISHYSKSQFERWYDINVAGMLDEYKDNFMFRWAVSADDLEDYKTFMDDFRVEQYSVTDKDGNFLVVLEKNGQLSFNPGDSLHFDDTDKALTLYVIYQYLAHKHDKNFDVLHFDDNVQLLNRMCSYFRMNRNLILDESRFLAIEWNSYEMVALPRSIIIGSGSCNPNYVLDAKVIARQCVDNRLSSMSYMHTYLNSRKAKRKNDCQMLGASASESFHSGFFRPVPVRARPLDLSYLTQMAELSMGPQNSPQQVAILSNNGNEDESRADDFLTLQIS